MKKLDYWLGLATWCVCISISNAASVLFDHNGSSPAGEVWSIYLDGGAENGNFDAIRVHITPDCGELAFRNVDELGFDGFTPRGPGDPFTFANRLIHAPPTFGGNGHSIIGLVVSEEVIEFTSGPLGQQIDTANDPNNGPLGLFLANVVTDRWAPFVEVDILSQGRVLQELSASSLCPEPTSVTLAVFGALGIACGIRGAGKRRPTIKHLARR